MLWSILSSQHSAHPSCAPVLQALVQMSLGPQAHLTPVQIISEVPPAAPAPTLRAGLSEQSHSSPGGVVSQSQEGRPSPLPPQRQLWGSKCSVNICLIEFGQGASSRQNPRQQDSVLRAGKSLGQKGAHQGLGCLTQTGSPCLPGGSLPAETGTPGNPALALPPHPLLSCDREPQFSA